MRFPHIPTALRALRRMVLKIFSPGPLAVPEKVAAQRLEICKVCPYNVGGQCTVCTCFISIKVMLSTETCPKKLWK